MSNNAPRAPMTAAELARFAHQLPTQLTFLRANWRDDGAEGETVHAVCRAAEQLLGEVQRLHAAHAQRLADDPEVQGLRARLAELEAQELPFCGHPVAELEGGAGAVTRCGACVAEAHQARARGEA